MPTDPCDEGLSDLARREANAVRQMAAEEPYKTAVSRLVNDPVWIAFA